MPTHRARHPRTARNSLGADCAFTQQQAAQHLLCAAAALKASGLSSGTIPSLQGSITTALLKSSRFHHLSVKTALPGHHRDLPVLKLILSKAKSSHLII